MNEQQNQIQQNQIKQTQEQQKQINQTQSQQVQVQQNKIDQQLAQEIAQMAEPKTVIDGQEVPLKQAQKLEQEFIKNNSKTGIKQQQNNSSEAVEAGQVAKHTKQPTKEEQEQMPIPHAEVQSGQEHLMSDHNTTQYTLTAKTKKKKADQ